MTGIWDRVAGKKTYLLSGALLVTGLGLVMAGRMSPGAGVILILVAGCGFPATFRAALQRHRDEEVAILVRIAETGEALSARNFGAAEAAAEGVVGLASALYPVIRDECAASKESEQA